MKDRTLPFKQVYLGAIVAFIILESLAIWSTYYIIGRGGQEIYALAVGLVDNIWLLLGSKILAFSMLAIPIYLMHKHMLPKYLHQKITAFIMVCIAIAPAILVAIFDVTHNLVVIKGVL